MAEDSQSEKPYICVWETIEDNRLAFLIPEGKVLE